ncbi:phosphate-starvation-inducible PsiE family protein [Pseudanabaena sp. FACHB-2040]|uniref:phosphate-starvation-inducible PsiE family protein n=1 Tax=Pseudanabaena sp. FACHB-2040 TaxID=2692859 RepID=UPI0016826169|nr:phosphate-starvation-inducible PsiE family protein [Pseudanabaena sp. FACHB-2040]MBD2256738.1 phosphate-starvation-inducible PsiE family protein [Pseudanabaena sp. FACHB-2040]
MSIWRRLAREFEDSAFLRRLGQFEGAISKVLSLAMVGVILVIVVDLFIVLTTALRVSPENGFFGPTLSQIFGLFLSVLIALEILENITAYLKKHVVQVELVIATALTAVGRKLVIVDLDKVTGTSLVGLAAAVFALSISYWIIRISHRS